MTDQPTGPHGPPDYEEVEHTADWALRVRGAGLAELLVNAARGLASLIAAEPDRVPLDEERRLELAAYDAESLLVAWLGELAYWAEAESLVFTRFHLEQVSPTALTAVVRGGRVSPLQKHIKAVTYHNLEIIDTGAGLEATVVFDV